MSDYQSRVAKSRVKRVGAVAGRFTWTPEQLRTMETMWRRGAPLKNIAVEVGRSRKAVCKMRVELGLPARKQMGVVRTGTLKMSLSAEELEGVQRMAHFRGVTLSAYIRRLLAADGAIGAS